ncbi:MAG: hypothetical protein L3K26_10400, partial [Candidatus Hydrogenedentes bacterium]|nr:hypothetical protein [Candidatus Hydrogenedentota bacterium]
GSVSLSMGLGLSVLAAIGQIDGNLRNAISDDLPDVAPSFFFVDIQQDQLSGFKERLADDPVVSRVQSAPMLRGVVTEINGRPAEEVVGDHWVVHGDRGITYAAEPSERMRITQGEWWPADYDGPPLISFAAEEGAELGLVLGDQITVNILGREVTATIASFPAREIIVATLGTLFNMGADVNVESEGLIATLRGATWPDGRPLFNIPVALSIMVFFALCAQCGATLITIKRETGRWRWPALAFAYMTVLAYTGSTITYQVASLLIPGV